jgi:hypothetical protein
MRLLLVGNSHLAAFKLGWNATAFPHQCVFFGAPGARMNRVILRDGVLRAPNPALRQILEKISGVSEVALADFDAVAVVGMQLGFPRVLTQTENVHVYGMSPLTPESALVSQSCLRHIVNGALSNTFGFEWAKRIKGVGKPVLLVPEPLLSETQARAFQDRVPELFSMYQSSVCSLASEHGFLLIEQPAHTIAFTGFTRGEFSRGSTRLAVDIEHRDDDYRHMNKEYGAVMFKEIFNAVEKRA